MKKFDRLMAIVMALQQRPETAQSLADKLEVSRRTIMRDMQSLSEMGVPLYAMPGPAGGYRLMEGYKLPPLHLNHDEALVILFALKSLTRIADTPFNQARWTAADKIREALPPSTVQQIEHLLQHMEMEIPDRQYAIPELSDLLSYTASSTWIQVYYRSANQARWLTMLPLRVYTAHGFWYVEAYSTQHQEKRTFRVDRMSQVTKLDAPTHELPDNIALQTDRDPATTSERVRVRAKLTYRGALRAEQDPHFGHHVEQINDQEWILDFACPISEWTWTVKFFYSLAEDAEVLEPDELRQDIRQLAIEVSKQYE